MDGKARIRETSQKQREKTSNGIAKRKRVSTRKIKMARQREREGGDEREDERGREGGG